jgi:hypothetical protein
MWQSKIAELEDRQLSVGLRRLSEADTSFAPSLGEFSRACKNPSNEPAHTDPNQCNEGVMGMARAYNIDPSGLQEWEVSALVWAKRFGGIHLEQLSQKLHDRLTATPNPDF